MADYKRLPGFGRDVVKESGHLAAHFVAGNWRASGSLVPSRRAVLQRVGDVACVVAATGPFAAQIMRGGASAPLPGESQRSRVYLLLQFMQSATNDFAWQTAKEALKGNAFDLGASLDRWRNGAPGGYRGAEAGSCALSQCGGLRQPCRRFACLPLPRGVRRDPGNTE